MTSSTSSSEPRPFVVPWGAVWAIALLVVLELSARFLPAGAFLAFDQHDYDAEDTQDYVAVGVAIDELPPADVIVIGTSRAREALQSPDLAAELGVTVRNYGAAGARADVWPGLLDRIADAGKLPHVFVLALDATDFRDVDPLPDRYRFVRASTLGAEIDRTGWPTEGGMTHVIGSSIPLRLLDARPAIRQRVLHGGGSTARWARANNAAFGGTTRWAREYRRSLVGRNRPPMMKVRDARIRGIARGYVVRDARLASLERFVKRAGALGVHVLLVELPPSPPLRERPEVIAARARLADALRPLARPCVSVWLATPADEAELGMREFRDPSHLNARGAGWLARRLASEIRPGIRGCE